jgi:hypothetical protein
MLLVSVERDRFCSLDSDIIESVDCIVASSSAANNEYSRRSKFLFFVTLGRLGSLLLNLASPQSLFDNTLHIHRHLF